MRFLADESLEYPVIMLLREDKMDILAVREIMRDAKDSEIVEYAFKNGC